MNLPTHAHYAPGLRTRHYLKGLITRLSTSVLYGQKLLMNDEFPEGNHYEAPSAGTTDAALKVGVYSVCVRELSLAMLLRCVKLCSCVSSFVQRHVSSSRIVGCPKFCIDIASNIVALRLGRLRANRASGDRDIAKWACAHGGTS